MSAATAQKIEEHEVVIIGAGVCGIYQLHRMLDMGVDAVVVEMSDDLGGTWYNNRYPGCRFDSESYTYGYSFSKELLNEWHWVEAYSPQPENLKYLNHVADKFNLRPHMQFNCKVDHARFEESEDRWYLDLSDGRTMSCRFMIMGLGLLSQPTLPKIKGREDYKGKAFHTYYWPHEGVDMKGKKVAIIGTGATAIQIIPEVAKEADSLTVFQRRANWAAPLNNYKITDEKMAEIRSRYDEIFEACAKSPGGFEHHPDRRGFWEVDRDERLAMWEQLYKEPGFGIWLKNFREIFTHEDANAEISEFIASKIRERVKDPVTAEKLIPKDHGFGVQRVPLETFYYEAYNRDNVELIDISETPIERITENGIKTSERDFDFDIIVYATGFDAITGAYDHMDIQGRDDFVLREKWSDGPETYLGMMVHGFPNMLMPAGPQSGSASTNYPRGIENGVNWCTDLLKVVWDKGYTRVEATAEAEERWTRHVAEMYSTMLMRKAKSWFTGYNSNVEGHEAGRIRYFVYNGGTPKYMKTINEVRDKGYEGVVLSSPGSSGMVPPHQIGDAAD
ncbi:MAG: flavin-containing monooxygenase [Minwuia sp.]|uniref:flavin-containing monooxygenase n=1 Tax=Minwuia sp. TaxID=2493630 RepID=UPI003A87EA9B